MSLNKAIKSGKERRKSYSGAKAVDCTCRNHGSCIYCQNTRLYRTNRLIEKTNQEMEDYEC
jgi:hypothetical protein